MILTSLSRRMFLVGAAALMTTRFKLDEPKQVSTPVSVVQGESTIATYLYKVAPGAVLQEGDAVTFDKNGFIRKAEDGDRIIGRHYANGELMPDGTIRYLRA